MANWPQRKKIVNVLSPEENKNMVFMSEDRQSRHTIMPFARDCFHMAAQEEIILA